MCDVGYLCANFSLPSKLGSRLRPDVRDRQTSDTHHRLCLRRLGAGHNKLCRITYFIIIIINSMQQKQVQQVVDS